MAAPSTEPRVALQEWAKEILREHPEYQEKRHIHQSHYLAPALRRFCSRARDAGHGDKLTLPVVTDVAYVLIDGDVPAARRTAAEKLAQEILTDRPTPTMPAHIQGLTATDLLREPLEPPSMLIEDLWQKEGCGIFGGEPKTLKTYSILEMGLALVTGGKVYGRFAVNQAGPVLIFLEETKRNEAKQRLTWLIRAKRLPFNGLGDLQLFIQRRVHLLDPRHQDEIRNLCSRHKPVACFFDHLGRMEAGAHHAPADVNPVLDFLRGLQVDYSTAVVLVDHLNRPKPGVQEHAAGRLPGAVKYAWLDCGLFFTARGNERDVVQVEGEHREAPNPDPFTIKRIEYQTPHGTAVRLEYNPGKLPTEKALQIAENMLAEAERAKTKGLTARELNRIKGGNAEEKAEARKYLLSTGSLIRRPGTRPDSQGRNHPADLHYLPQHAPSEKPGSVC